MSNSLRRPHLGRGWAFPVKPVGGRLQWATEEDDVDQAIEIILQTGRRERVMRPHLGTGLRDRVFDPNTAATARAIEEEVRSALVAQEPRITVERVVARAAPGQPNRLDIAVEYVVRRTNARMNRVFPFYLAHPEV